MKKFNILSTGNSIPTSFLNMFNTNNEQIQQIIHWEHHCYKFFKHVQHKSLTNSTHYLLGTALQQNNDNRNIQYFKTFITIQHTSKRIL